MRENLHNNVKNVNQSQIPNPVMFNFSSFLSHNINQHQKSISLRMVEHIYTLIALKDISIYKRKKGLLWGKSRIYFLFMSRQKHVLNFAFIQWGMRFTLSSYHQPGETYFRAWNWLSKCIFRIAKLFHKILISINHSKSNKSRALNRQTFAYIHLVWSFHLHFCFFAVENKFSKLNLSLCAQNMNHEI